MLAILFSPFGFQAPENIKIILIPLFNFENPRVAN